VALKVETKLLILSLWSALKFKLEFKSSQLGLKMKQIFALSNFENMKLELPIYMD